MLADTSSLFMPDVRRLQKIHKKQLQFACKQLGFGNITRNNNGFGDINLSRIYVDDKYKLLYCEVPKIACTNWKRILLMLTGKMNTTDPEQLRHILVHSKYQRKYLRTLNTYDPKEILFKIKHYYKFMFVREPLERIVSAYRDKFVTSNNQLFRLRYGRKIILRYRKFPTNHSLQYGDDVRFIEFVQYLLDLKGDKEFEAHWRFYNQLCQPCQLGYDFIGKYETLKEDASFILEELGIKGLVRFPRRPSNATPMTADIMKSMFANISAKRIHDLWHLYSNDYSLFGYPYPTL